LSLLVLAAGPVALAIAAGPVSAGEAPQLTITKVIEGTPPPSAQFVVDITCENATPSPAQVTFTGTGSEIVIVDSAGATCTVTENGTAGAAVSYACEITASPGGNNSLCTSNQSVFFGTGAVFATVTVTNDFRPPPEPAAAAQPVEAVARFTG
jgi:hypothetical protein